MSTTRSDQATTERERLRPSAILHESAGALVVIDGKGLALRQGREWILPKGHLQAGERPEDAAVREVSEETGLRIQIVAELGTTRYAFGRGHGAVQRKRVHWFLAQAVGGAIAPEHDFDEAVLLPLDVLGALLTHEADRRLLVRASGMLDAAAPGPG
jgi:8-oxo-dGTP pyrophosphatase MutT (NUDIX family)